MRLSYLYNGNPLLVCLHHDIDGLMQERHNSSAKQWSYVFFALNHRYCNGPNVITQSNMILHGALQWQKQNTDIILH